MRQLHVRAKHKRNMLYIIAIVGAFIFLAMSEDKQATPKYVKNHTFSEEQIDYLQSVGLITDEEIQKYKNNKQK